MLMHVWMSWLQIVCYISFPVTIFYYFNRPSYYKKVKEEWDEKVNSMTRNVSHMI